MYDEILRIKKGKYYNIIVGIFILVVGIIFVCVIGFSIKANKQVFYTDEYKGIVTKLRYDQRKQIEIYLNNKWIPLASYNLLLNQIDMGDSVYKIKNTYCVTIYKLKDNKVKRLCYGGSVDSTSITNK